MCNMYSWFGIDFGTTNSAAVSLTGTDSNTVESIHYGDSKGRPMPSVVAIDKSTGEVIVGRDAKDKRNSLIQTHEYFTSIKMRFSSDTENITTKIFENLKKRIERDENNQINEAVVAVPVGFSRKKKEYLRNAAKEAGIDVKMFISEPTAAFYSNYKQLKGCSNVAVFDWGGGTLDVVILEIKNGFVNELASEGLDIAGDHIDESLARRIHSDFMRTKQFPVSFEDLDGITKDRLLMECERAKCELENEDIVSINIFKYGNFGSLNESIDYKFFSLLIEKDIDNAINCLERAIKESGKSHTEINRILCVGGSSKLRPIQDRLFEKYGEDTVYCPKGVMWAIAEGAAFISTRQGNHSLHKPIGVILSDNTFLPIFPQGHPLPCEEKELYFGVVDNAKIANIIITDSENENEREFAKHLTLPICGYFDEAITLKCFIDEDFIFRMIIQSSKMPKDTGIDWTYDKLKISYRLDA